MNLKELAREIYKQKKVHNKKALDSLIREAHNKWREVIFKPNGVILKFSPEIFDEEISYGYLTTDIL